MKKRFVVSISSSTPVEERAFIDWLTGKYGWWHWVSNFWLISDSLGSLTAESVRDKLRECFPGALNFVIELREDGETWAGAVASGEVENAKKWLNEWWNK